MVFTKKKPRRSRFTISRKSRTVGLAVFIALILTGLIAVVYYSFLLSEDTSQAEASSLLTSNFDPADCSTYATNGGSLNNGICFVKLYEVAGNLYTSYDINPSESITVKLFYNNQSANTLSNANINDSIPSGFTATDFKNKLLDTPEVTLEASISGSFSRTPLAGYYGYGNTETNGLFTFGKKEFFHLAMCEYQNFSQYSQYYGDKSNLTYDIGNGSGASNDTSWTANCSGSSHLSGSSNSGTSVQSISLDGNRYFHLAMCEYQNSSQYSQYYGDKSNLTYDIGNGSGANNSSSGWSPSCSSSNHLSGYSFTFSNVQTLDLLNNRYFHLNLCEYDNSGQYSQYYGDKSNTSNLIGTGSRVNNSLIYTSTCAATTHDPASVFSSKVTQTIDLLDINRSYGYMSYTLTAPASGLDELTDYGTDASLTGDSLNLIDNQNELSAILGNPSITFDKVYWDGNSELTTFASTPGGAITVRLKYNNTGDAKGSGITLSDSIETDYFDYLPGTLKNCYQDADCLNLDDSLISGLNDFNIAPSAGYYLTSTSSTFSNVDIGKDRYLSVIQCDNGTSSNSFIATTTNSETPTTGNCSDYGLVGYTKIDEYNIDILGKQYLNYILCENAGYTDTILAGASNSADPSSITCDSLGLTGYTKVGTYTVDIEGKAYLNQLNCLKNSQTNTFTTGGSSSNSASSQVCNNFQLTGYTESGGSSVQLLNTLRGYGYIEYQIEPNTQANGSYGTIGEMSGSNIPTISADLSNSIAVSYFCNQINPNGDATRNLTLSDAELRTDQDFTCNFSSSLCPVVFFDSNANGVFDAGDTQTESNVINLYRDSNNQLLGSLTTNLSTPQCFDALGLGTDYRLEIASPLTAYSTTGGDTNIERIAMDTGQGDSFFGYSNGALSLSAPSTITYPGLSFSYEAQQTAQIIDPVQVIDARPTADGWTVTATVTDFVGDLNPVENLVPISNAFTATPQSVVVVSGEGTNVSPGTQKTVTSDSDPVDIFSAGVGYGLGTYQTSIQTVLDVPAFAGADTYRSTTVFVIF